MDISDSLRKTVSANSCQNNRPAASGETVSHTKFKDPDFPAQDDILQWSSGEIYPVSNLFSYSYHQLVQPVKPVMPEAKQSTVSLNQVRATYDLNME